MDYDPFEIAQQYSTKKPEQVPMRPVPKPMVTPAPKPTPVQAAAEAAAPAPVSKPPIAKTEPVPASISEKPVKPGKKEKKPKPKRTFYSVVGNVVPYAGDRATEWLRKSVFLLALLTLIGSLSYISNRAVIQPWINIGLTEQLINIKNNPAVQSAIIAQLPADFPFPPAIGDEFKAFYAQNTDFRGWLTYNASGNDFLKINYAVCQTTDNDFYLSHTFYKKGAQTGNLFFDYRCGDLTASFPHMTIIYGHNLSTGQMFSGMNRFMTMGKGHLTADAGVPYIKSAATFTLQNLTGTPYQCKVFAVILADAIGITQGEFNYVRPGISGTDLQQYLNDVEQRSLYKMGVDVNQNDQIVVLSTCGMKSNTTLDNCRTVVFARIVRAGEDPSVNTAGITANPAPLMPKQWYVNQGVALPPYYGTTAGTGTAAAPVA